MASTTEPNQHHHHDHRRRHPHHPNPVNNIPWFIQSTASSLSSLLPFHPPSFPFPMLSPSQISSTTHSPSLSKIYVPLLFTESTPPQLISLPPSSHFKSTQTDSPPSSTPRGSSSDSSSDFPSTVRISGLKYALKGGPAFVGQVFSMCDLSGTGLMAVSTHFDIPFISRRTPEWVKKVFASITKSERNDPVFRFFIDVGDAVSYVRKLNIPRGMVGACRLDLAFEHFKEKPHLFQFVPNEKQVKEASKLLKIMSHNGGRKRVDGVPVFSAQNLDIAIATADGIKWYTPYFFDKNLLDTILEESVDQHFHALIQTRRQERDVVANDSDAEVIEETGERMWEALEDMGALMGEALDNDILESAISEAVESKLLNAVDKVLLGNRWLRKATGIQPKFPYTVDSFEERSAASLRRASGLSSSVANSELENSKYLQHHGTTELLSKDSVQAEQVQSFRFPFGDWCRHPFSNQHHNQSVKRVEGEASEGVRQESQHSPLLPRITMVGITTREDGKVSNSNLRKTMTDLTRELQQTEQGNTAGTEFKCEDRDPLFVANVDGASKKVHQDGTDGFLQLTKDSN